MAVRRWKAGHVLRRASVDAGRVSSFVTAAAVVAFAASMLVTGSAASAAPTKASPSAGELTRALRAWAGFPVAATPRPLVLLQGDVLDPENGFPSDDSKTAYGNGQITPPPVWPPAPRASLGWPVDSAAAAFTTLTTPESNVLGSPPPLHATGVQFGAGPFLTDRGWRTLPAWLFSLSGVQNPAKVLAVAPSALYTAAATHGGRSPSQLSVTVGAERRRIVANFAGAPAGSGPCTASSTLRIKESRHAVAVRVVAHPHLGRLRAGVACALVAYPRHASARLAAPLGARVVVDAQNDGAAAATFTAPGRTGG